MLRDIVLFGDRAHLGRFEWMALSVIECCPVLLVTISALSTLWYYGGDS